MIEKWSVQSITHELEHVRDGINVFKDHRGKISNHELTEPINLIGLMIQREEQLELIIITRNKNKNVCL